MRVKTIVSSAIDLDEMLGDALCNMTTASSLDLIYMTTEQEQQPYNTRPYVWDLIRFLQNKLLKIKKHAILNGLDSEALAKRVSANLQLSVTKEFYTLVKSKKMTVFSSDHLQLFFEFKFLTMTILKDLGEEELAFNIKKCHQGILRLISRQKKDYIDEESCLSAETSATMNKELQNLMFKSEITTFYP
jgi:hypothetical protein